MKDGLEKAFWKMHQDASKSKAKEGNSGVAREALRFGNAFMRESSSDKSVRHCHDTEKRSIHIVGIDR